MLISFFPLLLWITAENGTKFKKLFIWTKKSGGTQHHKHTVLDYSSATTIMLQWHFGLNVIYALFLIAGIHLTTNLKTFEQAEYVFNSANTQFLSEWPLEEKSHIFIGMYSLFTWFNIQILNLCKRWHRCIPHPLNYLK